MASPTFNLRVPTGDLAVIGRTLREPSFHDLDLESRRFVLNQLDPGGFAALPFEEQNNALEKAYREFKAKPPQHIQDQNELARQTRELLHPEARFTPEQVESPVLGTLAKPIKQIWAAEEAEAFKGQPPLVVTPITPPYRTVRTAPVIPVSQLPPGTVPLPPQPQIITPEEEVPETAAFLGPEESTRLLGEGVLKPEELRQPVRMLDVGARKPAELPTKAVPLLEVLPMPEDVRTALDGVGKAYDETHEILFGFEHWEPDEKKSALENAANGLIQVAGSLSEPENVLLFAIGAGAGGKLRELANLPKVAKYLRQYPRVAKALGITAEVAVPGTYAAYGAEQATEDLTDAYKRFQAGDKAGASQSFGRALGGLALGAGAGRAAIKRGRAEARVYPQAEEIAPRPLRPVEAEVARETGIEAPPRREVLEAAPRIAEELEAGGQRLAAEQWRTLAEEWQPGKPLGIDLAGGRKVTIRERPTSRKMPQQYQVEDETGKLVTVGSKDEVAYWLRQNAPEGRIAVAAVGPVPVVAEVRAPATIRQRARAKVEAAPVAAEVRPEAAVVPSEAAPTRPAMEHAPPEEIPHQPWEITAQDYADWEADYFRRRTAPITAGYRAWHHEQVAAAAQRGETVPEEVLAEYPDLAKPAAPTAPPERAPVAAEEAEVGEPAPGPPPVEAAAERPVVPSARGVEAPVEVAPAPPVVPAPAEAPAPAREPITRTTPRKGTTERTELDDTYLRLDGETDAQYEKLRNLKEAVERAGYGTKTRAAADRRLEKFNSEYEDWQGRYEEARRRSYRADLEDAAEQTENPILEEVARYELSDPEQRAANYEAAHKRVVVRLRDLVGNEIRAGEGYDRLPAARDAELVKSALRDQANDLFSHPLLAADAEKRVVSAIGGQRLRAYRDRAVGDMRAKEPVPGWDKEGFGKRIEGVWSFDRIDELAAEAEAARQSALTVQTQVEKSERKGLVKAVDRLRPLAEVRAPSVTTKAAWGGNEAQEGRYVTDGSMAIDMRAVPGMRKSALAKQVREPKNIPQPTVERYLSTAIPKANVRLTELGQIPSTPDQPTREHLVYYADSKGRVYGLNAERVRLIQSLTGAESLRGEAPDKAVVFYRANQPVALLMPMRVDSVPFDVPTALERAKVAGPVVKAAPRPRKAKVPAEPAPTVPVVRPEPKSSEAGFVMSDLLMPWRLLEPTPAKPLFEFSDPATEANFQEAKREQRDTLLDRARGAAAWTRSVTRVYAPIPRGAQYGEFTFRTKQVEKAPNIALASAAERLYGLYKDVTPDEADFAWKGRTMLDLIAMRRKGLAEAPPGTTSAEFWREMPFKLTPEALEADYDRWKAEAKQHPKVTEYLDAQRSSHDAMIGDLQEAAEAANVGRLYENVKREDYLRHRVVEYIQANPQLGVTRIRVPAGRGWLKRRGFTAQTYSTNVAAAEFEVTAQILRDTAMLRYVAWLRNSEHNIKPQLIEQAKAHNVAVVKEWFNDLAAQINKEAPAGTEAVTGDELFRQALNQKQAIAINRLAQLAADDQLPVGPGGEWADFVTDLADAYERWVGEKADAADMEAAEKPQIDVDMPQLLGYAAWALAEAEKEQFGAARGAAGLLFKGIQHKKAEIKRLAGKKFVTWEDLIPETHEAWQARKGNAFFWSHTLGEQAAQEILAANGEEIGVSAKELRRALTLAGKREQLVLPVEVVATVESLYPAKDTRGLRPLIELHRKLYNAWKQWQLLSPTRFVKYNLRNLSGDADAVFVGNPHAFLKVPQAVSELWGYFYKHEFTGELKEWFKRGAFESTLQAQETGDIERLPQIRRLVGVPQGFGGLLKRQWQRARIATNFRELILRYAANLDYLEQMQGSPEGRPRNFGASIEAEVMALKDVRDRAYKLSNDLLGAYDEISVAGQATRQHIIPFWSYQELNGRRYYRFFKNAARNDRITGSIGKKLAGTLIFRTPYYAYRAGATWLKILAFSAMMQAINLLLFPEEEKDLPKEVRSRPHIIYGRGADGEPKYMTRLTNLSDAMDWFGPEDWNPVVEDWLNGKTTALGAATEIVKGGPAQKLWQSIGPEFKLAQELVTGVTGYPDIRKPRLIRDRAQHLADSLALGDVYRHATGKPTRGILPDVGRIFWYSTDPGQSAFFDLEDEKRRFLRGLGKEPWMGGSNTTASDALRNMKLALRYEDRNAFARYLEMYVASTPNPSADALIRSIRNMHPLAGLNKDEQAQFVAQLDPEGKELLRRATRYYEETFLGPRLGEYFREAVARLRANRTIAARTAAKPR